MAPIQGENMLEWQSADLAFRKSSYCGDPTGQSTCVEAAIGTDGATPVFVLRDSKDPSGPRLGLSITQAASFLDAVKRRD